MSDTRSQPGVTAYFDNGQFINILVSYDTFVALREEAEEKGEQWVEVPTYADSADLMTRPVFREQIRLSRILRIVEIPDDLIELREAEARAAALMNPSPLLAGS